jgi:excisionase family DNA binding protein
MTWPTGSEFLASLGNNLDLFTVAEVAKRLSVQDDVILGHIRSGRLAAVNVGLGSRRPRWRISTESLEQFLALRTSVGQPEKPRRRRKRQEVVTEFF